MNSMRDVIQGDESVLRLVSSVPIIKGKFCDDLSPEQMAEKYNLSTELAALNERLHARCDELVAARPRQRVVSIAPAVTSGRKAQALKNPFYLRVMQDAEQAYPRWADDILSGITRADWYGLRDEQIPLSSRKLLEVLGHLEEITTQDVQLLLRLNERHAQRYVQAARMCIPHLLRSVPKSVLAEEVNYPDDSLKRPEHWHDLAKEMRLEGFGPTAISAATQQPLSTVKQYLRRNPRVSST